MKKMYNIEPFIRLGQKLRENNAALNQAIKLAMSENSWFTAENIRFAIEAITLKMCDKEALSTWTQGYTPPTAAKNVGVIMAGNIPLAGFFDQMCVLISGHRCYVKMSSKDCALMGYVVGLLGDDFTIESFTDQSPIDAVIATGSNNTNRYFSAHYSHIPHLLRHSRTSVAVVAEGDNIEGLGEDVFRYFGMGCRNVSRIFLPTGFDIEKLRSALIINKITHKKYLNIYRQHKAVLELRGEEFTDGGFFTLRQSSGSSEALTDIIYQQYNSLDDVEKWLSINDSSIQCVVSNSIVHPRQASIGHAQSPELWDYPDGADVLAFLSNI